MINMDSKSYAVRSGFGGHTITITHRASGIIKQFSRSVLPDVLQLSLMSENRFNAVCRAVFNGEKYER